MILNSRSYYMIKALMLIATLLPLGLTMNKAHAEGANPLMVCLGQEELKIHRSKTTGPVYYLNQLFISEFATIMGIKLKKPILDKVCQSKSFSPSVMLLRTLLLEGKDSFAISNDPNIVGVDALAIGSLESFLETVPAVFINYLSHLQALTKTSGCLPKEIPEIAYFLERTKWLEDIIGPNEVLNEEAKIKNIFRKLEGLDQILAKCEKLHKKELQRRKEAMKTSTLKR